MPPQDALRSIQRTTSIVLTPVEAERLNGFDDDWTIGMPEKWKYFCMGDALIVDLIGCLFPYSFFIVIKKSILARFHPCSFLVPLSTQGLGPPSPCP
jgi:hypothetical protein